MVGLVIVSHSAALADGVVELAREMGAGEVPIEAAGGIEDGALGTDAGRVYEAVERVRSPDGVLVLMDLGSALMSAEMAAEMADPDDGPILLSEAPLVEGAVAAAARARGGGSLDEVAREARGALAMKSTQLGDDEPEAAADRLASRGCRGRRSSASGWTPGSVSTPGRPPASSARSRGSMRASRSSTRAADAARPMGAA